MEKQLKKNIVLVALISQWKLALKAVDENFDKIWLVAYDLEFPDFQYKTNHHQHTFSILAYNLYIEPITTTSLILLQDLLLINKRCRLTLTWCMFRFQFCTAGSSQMFHICPHSPWQTLVCQIWNKELLRIPNILRFCEYKKLEHSKYLMMITFKRFHNFYICWNN